ncbi:BgTH12-05275, partial [Blumeria graminis f. sp. triticale]
RSSCAFTASRRASSLLCYNTLILAIPLLDPFRNPKPSIHDASLKVEAEFKTYLFLLWDF